MKSFRQDPRKLLKSLTSENNDFAVSRDFKGLRQVLFRALLDLRFFCPCADVETGLSYRNFLLARILFMGKINRPGRMSARKAKFAAYVRVHGIDRLVAVPISCWVQAWTVFLNRTLPKQTCHRNGSATRT
jgi:hypothetical protein